MQSHTAGDDRLLPLTSKMPLGGHEYDTQQDTNQNTNTSAHHYLFASRMSHRPLPGPHSMSWPVLPPMNRAPHHRPTDPQDLVHHVYIIRCVHCDAFFSNRGMKAVLLLRPGLALFSTDALPKNCSPLSYTPIDDSLETLIRTCDCLTQTLHCHGCGSNAGYMIVSPCERCTSSGSANGHRFVFHSSQVVGAPRLCAPGELGVAPQFQCSFVPRPAASPGPVDPSTASAPIFGEIVISPEIHQDEPTVPDLEEDVVEDHTSLPDLITEPSSPNSPIWEEFAWPSALPMALPFSAPAGPARWEEINWPLPSNPPRPTQRVPLYWHQLAVGGEIPPIYDTRA